AANRAILCCVRDAGAVFEEPVHDIRDGVDDIHRASISLDVVMVLAQGERIRRRGRTTLIKIVAMVQLAILCGNRAAWPPASAIAALDEGTNGVGGLVARGFRMNSFISVDDGCTFAQPFDGLWAHPPESLQESWCVLNVLCAKQHQLGYCILGWGVAAEDLQHGLRAADA